MLPFYCEDQMQHSIMNQFVNKTRTAYIKMIRFYVHGFELEKLQVYLQLRDSLKIVKSNVAQILHNKACHLLHIRLHFETHVLTALNSDIVNLLIFVDEVVLCFEKMT